MNQRINITIYTQKKPHWSTELISNHKRLPPLSIAGNILGKINKLDDDLDFLETSNIIHTGRRTRGVKIDYSKVSQEDLDDDEEDDEGEDAVVAPDAADDDEDDEEDDEEEEEDTVEQAEATKGTSASTSSSGAAGATGSSSSGSGSGSSSGAGPAATETA